VLLREVRVENFRGLRSAVLSLDPTTVLIGENDCGRSSLLEAIAIVLGWRADGTEFRFQPVHIHRSATEPPSAPPPIRIALEFGESVDAEWSCADFALLREALPGVLDGDRRFLLEVTASSRPDAGWTFRTSRDEPLVNHEALLVWLRRRMPVFWLKEGMLVSQAAASNAGLKGDSEVRRQADTVSRNYQDLIAGTAMDAAAALESGAAAARRLLLEHANLSKGRRNALDEMLEGSPGRRKTIRAAGSPEPLEKFGTAAQNIGLLLLVGTMLRLGADRVERGVDPLTLIENPEAHLHPMTLASIWSVIERIGGQKIVATHSGTLLGSARLSSVRRLTRREGFIAQWRVPEGALTADELRRYAYHLRSRRAAASFARCWLLVEGETEFWLMGELARVCGYDLASEGVACVEFAQSGLSSLIKVASHLGIQWHLMSDGDQAGRTYAESAARLAGPDGLEDRVTLLQEPDIEHCFWQYGYADTLRRIAYPRNAGAEPEGRRNATARAVIKRAIERHSKPFLAVLLLDEVIGRGPGGVPKPLRAAIETCIRLARS
jgi:putative ATP-dependent endonuclease of OLD family